MHSQNLFPELKEDQSKELAEDVICYEAGSEDLIRESQTAECKVILDQIDELFKIERVAKDFY